MYFEKFDIQNISTDSCKNFIEKLSDLLEVLNPSLVDKENIRVTCELINNEECIKVYIPHKTKRILNLTIENDEEDSTVELADARFHFQEYKDDNQRIADAINLISKIMKSTIEVQTFYKGKRKVKRKPYFISEEGTKEPFQSSYYNLPALINPFLSERKVIERGSFCIEKD